MTNVSTADYDRILAIIAEVGACGTPEEPVPLETLAAIRSLARADGICLFEGVPWRRSQRRRWVIPDIPVTASERQIVDAYRFQIPLFPGPHTYDRVLRASDLIERRAYVRTDMYQLFGRPRGIEYTMDAWRLGTDGVVRGLSLDASAHDFSDATRDAVEVLTKHLWRLLERASIKLGDRAPGLTGRQTQVLALVANGRSNDQIGEVLGISSQTVRKHLENIFDLIEAHSRADAIVWAQRHRASRATRSTWIE